MIPTPEEPTLRRFASGRITTTVSISIDQDARLRALCAATRVKRAVYLRDAIDLVLAQNDQILAKSAA